MTSEMPTYNQDYEYLRWVSSRSADPLRYVYDLFIAYKDVYHSLGLRRGQKLLDVGSCNGRFGQYFSHLGINTTGIDLNLSAIYQGRIDFPDNPISLVNGDAAHLPFENHSFDKVMSYDVMEHIPERLLPKVFGEMSRVSSGSTMFHKITTLEDTVNIDRDLTHVTKWDTDGWTKFFDKHGWQVMGSTTRNTPKLKTLYGNFLLVAKN